MYILQNTAVAASAAAGLLCLLAGGGSAAATAPGEYPTAYSPWLWGLVVTAIIFGTLSSVGAMGSSLAVEREWTKTLAQGDSSTLSTLNAGPLPYPLCSRQYWDLKLPCLD